MIETSSVFLESLRQSSVILKNLWKMFGNVHVTFGQVLENLRKSSESFCHSNMKFISPRHRVISSMYIGW